MDAIHTARTGMQSAQVSLATSAHNLANLLTEDFRPQRAEQRSLRDGGSSAQVSAAPQPEAVRIEREILDQIQASAQYTASLRVLEVGHDLRGHLLDVLA